MATTTTTPPVLALRYAPPTTTSRVESLEKMPGHLRALRLALPQDNIRCCNTKDSGSGDNKNNKNDKNDNKNNENNGSSYANTKKGGAPEAIDMAIGQFVTNNSLAEAGGFRYVDSNYLVLDRRSVSAPRVSHPLLDALLYAYDNRLAFVFSPALVWRMVEDAVAVFMHTYEPSADMMARFAYLSSSTADATHCICLNDHGDDSEIYVNTELWMKLVPEIKNALRDMEAQPIELSILVKETTLQEKKADDNDDDKRAEAEKKAEGSDDAEKADSNSKKETVHIATLHLNKPQIVPQTKMPRLNVIPQRIAMPEPASMVPDMHTSIGFSVPPPQTQKGDNNNDVVTGIRQKDGGLSSVLFRGEECDWIDLMNAIFITIATFPPFTGWCVRLLHMLHHVVLHYQSFVAPARRLRIDPRILDLAYHGDRGDDGKTYPSRDPVTMFDEFFMVNHEVTSRGECDVLFCGRAMLLFPHESGYLEVGPPNHDEAWQMSKHFLDLDPLHNGLSARRFCNLLTTFDLRIDTQLTATPLHYYRAYVGWLTHETRQGTAVEVVEGEFVTFGRAIQKKSLGDMPEATRNVFAKHIDYITAGAKTNEMLRNVYVDDIITALDACEGNTATLAARLAHAKNSEDGDPFLLSNWPEAARMREFVAQFDDEDFLRCKKEEAELKEEQRKEQEAKKKEEARKKKAKKAKAEKKAVAEEQKKVAEKEAERPKEKEKEEEKAGAETEEKTVEETKEAGREAREAERQQKEAERQQKEAETKAAEAEARQQKEQKVVNMLVQELAQKIDAQQQQQQHLKKETANELQQIRKEFRQDVANRQKQYTKTLLATIEKSVERGLREAAPNPMQIIDARLKKHRAETSEILQKQSEKLATEMIGVVVDETKRERNAMVKLLLAELEKQKATTKREVKREVKGDATKDFKSVLQKEWKRESSKLKEELKAELREEMRQMFNQMGPKVLMQRPQPPQQKEEGQAKEEWQNGGQTEGGGDPSEEEEYEKEEYSSKEGQWEEAEDDVDCEAKSKPFELRVAESRGRTQTEILRQFVQLCAPPSTWRPLRVMHSCAAHRHVKPPRVDSGLHGILLALADSNIRCETCRRGLTTGSASANNALLVRFATGRVVQPAHEPITKFARLLYEAVTAVPGGRTTFGGCAVCRREFQDNGQYDLALLLGGISTNGSAPFAFMYYCSNDNSECIRHIRTASENSLGAGFSFVAQSYPNLGNETVVRMVCSGAALSQYDVVMHLDSGSRLINFSCGPLLAVN